MLAQILTALFVGVSCLVCGFLLGLGIRQKQHIAEYQKLVAYYMSTLSTLTENLTKLQNEFNDLKRFLQ